MHNTMGKNYVMMEKCRSVHTSLEIEADEIDEMKQCVRMPSFREIFCPTAIHTVVNKRSVLETRQTEG